ncbi:MAG: sugar phosphate nucleotidyltransferase [bacterium]
MDLSLVVLAAGMGSRYGGLKQLDPVGPSGEILLDYSVDDALVAGFTKIIFVIRREMLDLFIETVGKRYEQKIGVEYAFQELEPLPGGRVSPPGRTKPWGTGHAVLSAAPLLREPFAVINADDYYGASGFSALAAFLKTTSPDHYAMVGYRLEKTLSDHGTVSRGICHADQNGYLIDITERTAIERTSAGIMAQGNPPVLLTGAEPTSMNFWGLMPDFLGKLGRLFEEFLEERGEDAKAEFYLPAAVSSLIGTDEATVRLLHSSDPWLGLTYPEDRPIVVEALKCL